jgi:hypothetical protein
VGLQELGRMFLSLKDLKGMFVVDEVAWNFDSW